MKKYSYKFALILAVVVTTSGFAGCGSSTNTASSSGSRETKEEAASSSASSASDLNAPTAENPRKILISVNSDSNPDSYIGENGEYTGFEPEMLKAIDELLPEYEFEYTTISSTDALLALETDKIDASLQRWEENEERRKKYLFTNEYYLTYSQNLTVYGADSAIQSLDDLKEGTKIWVKAAGGSDDYFWQTYNAEHPDAQVELIYVTGGYSVAIPMFQNGELEACTMVQRNVDRINQNYGSEFTTVGDTIMASDCYILFNLDETTLRDRVDEALAQLRKEGKLSELSIEWYGEDYTVDEFKEK
ncbi:MAG: transporter substrate-binding domain-containing protein [Fusicatenibacter sp.]|nr:transporter substrate-binding domain-containing protein [Fusicatenibacter sp.]